MVIHETNLAFTRPLVPRKDTKRIVIHHTVSGDRPAHTFHDEHLAKPRWGGLGYHYIIRADGTIERGRPELVRGVHAPAANADSIGVALTGNFETRPPTTAQMNALVWLVRDIRTRLGDLPVVGHRDVTATACPGRLFPWTELQRRLAQRTHLVVRGDTLFGLARRYGVTVGQIRAWNNLESTTIRVGQVLIIG